MRHIVSIGADLSAIFVAVIGGIGYLKYVRLRHKKARKLEAYLRDEKSKRQDKGQRSLLRIVRDVGLTQDEILQASFDNPRIARRVAENERGLASDLLFEYVDDK